MDMIQQLHNPQHTGLSGAIRGVYFPHAIFGASWVMGSWDALKNDKRDQWVKLNPAESTAYNIAAQLLS